MAVVGKIVSVAGARGVVRVNGVERSINLSLVAVEAGDFVSVAGNLAVEKLSSDDAEAILRAREDACAGN